MKDQYRIFVINPGSTSTKLALFENEDCLFATNVFHDSTVLLKFKTINAQLPYRLKVIREFIEENKIDMNGIDAFVGRGGSCYPVESGVYEVTPLLLKDTIEAKGGLHHPSNLGIQLANEMVKMYGGRMFMMDPTVMDELCDLARVTGIKGVYRRSILHALNQKETARRHAANIGKKYEDCNFIVCHIDGGITISAHEKGRIIDTNNGGGGDGPFTPTRMGSLAITELMDFWKGRDVKDLWPLTMEAGGFTSYFGTSNSDIVHKKVEEGDSQAVRVWQAMCYQICKNIGAMAAALGSKPDAIVLTGGLLRFTDITEFIEQHCGWIAPVTAYPGEFEMEALAGGALRVMRGEEEPKVYTGKPVWRGFPDD